MIGVWQTMETAPKDGTVILVAPQIVLAWWLDEAMFERCERRPGWQVHSGEDDCWYAWALEPNEPTHWMSLPERPR